jgi:uncharacterized protein YuzE
MGNSYFFKHIPSLLLVLGIMLTNACNNDEDIIFDDSLQILSQKIDGEAAVNGVDGINRNPTIEIIFSHTLKTAEVTSALSLTSGSGAVAFEAAYSNTNSTLTLTPETDLDYETTYTLTLPAGTYGEDNNSLKESYSLTFTTAPFVPVNVSLSTDVTAISETDGTAILTVSLSEEVELDVTVELQFGGAATQGADFTVSATTVVLTAGETAAEVTIAGLLDGAVEGTEEIEVSIASVTNAEELTPQLVTITLLDADIDSNGDGFPDRGFIINEVLFDPPGGDPGDANGDGTRSASEDEFIEFVNDSDQEIDLSGYTLYDATNLASGEPNHTFPAGTVVPAGGVYVLFGGGSPSGDFGNALVGVSTSGNMNLSNADDVVTLLDADGNTVLTFDTQGEGAGIDFGADQSVTRFPDINGDFTLHTAANAALLFSPGKQVDGTDLGTEGGGNPGLGFRINEVLFDPPADLPGDANGDGVRSASEDEFIEFVNDSNQEVDLSGFTLYDATNLDLNEPRHTFPAGTIIPPGGVYVLFGGGTPSGGFGGAMVGVSTTGNMNLSNGDDIITILDLLGNTFLTFDTQGEGAGIDFGADQSVSRSPDISGDFMLHTTANPALLFSPGTKTDGSAF